MFATKNAMDSARRSNRPVVSTEEQAQIEQRRIAKKVGEEVQSIINGCMLCIQRNSNQPLQLKQCIMGNISNHQYYFVGPKKYTNEEGIRTALNQILANPSVSDSVRTVIREILPQPLSTVSIPMEDIRAYNKVVRLQESILQFRHSVMLCILKNNDAYKLKQCIMGLILGKNVQQRTNNYWNKLESTANEREITYREALNSILFGIQNSTLLNNYQNYKSVEINQDTIQKVITEILNLPNLAKYSMTNATQNNIKQKWNAAKQSTTNVYSSLFRKGGKTMRRRPRKCSSKNKKRRGSAA